MVSTNPDALGIPFGKYQLLERLGRGGMAEVWKAKALGPMGYARKLVVKRVLPELVSDEEFVRMFVEEARVSASLNHRNIVQVYEFGDVGGEYYLAMEWVHGRDVNTLLRTLQAAGQEPSVGLGAYVAREICRALAYAHALTDDDGRPLGLIHRDVSPSNVMIGFDGSVKLLDFGIAKAMAVANENKTQAGVLKGKLGYLSPEQVEGAPVDHRADLFVAGIVLWEMLTLRRLFKGGSEIQTIALVRAARALPPSAVNPAVPPELDAVCMRALQQRRDDRFADCGEMAAALDEVVHALKFGSEQAARLLRRTFPDAREPTQPMPLPPVDGAHTPSAPRLPPPPASQASHRTPTPTPVGQLADPPPPPPSPTMDLRKRVAGLTGAALRDWHARHRRSLTIVGSAAIVAVVGVAIGGRRPPRAAAVHVTAAAAPPPVIVVKPAPLPPFVHVTVTTRPAGALVQMEGDHEPRGTTPLELTLRRGTQPRQLVLTAAGYQRRVADVVPDEDARLHFELERAAPPRRRAVHHRSAAPPLPARDSVGDWVN